MAIAFKELNTQTHEVTTVWVPRHNICYVNTIEDSHFVGPLAQFKGILYHVKLVEGGYLWFIANTDEISEILEAL